MLISYPIDEHLGQSKHCLSSLAPPNLSIFRVSNENYLRTIFLLDFIAPISKIGNGSRKEISQPGLARTAFNLGLRALTVIGG